MEKERIELACDSFTGQSVYRCYEYKGYSYAEYLGKIPYEE